MVVAKNSRAQIRQRYVPTFGMIAVDVPITNPGSHFSNCCVYNSVRRNYPHEACTRLITYHALLSSGCAIDGATSDRGRNLQFRNIERGLRRLPDRAAGLSFGKLLECVRVKWRSNLRRAKQGYGYPDRGHPGRSPHTAQLVGNL